MKVNLLLAQNNYLKRDQFFLVKLATILVGVGVLFALWHLVLSHKLKISRLQLKKNQVLLDRLTKHDQTNQHKKQMKIVENSLVGLGEKRRRFARVIDRVYQGIVSNIYLTKLVIKNDSVKLFGKTSSTSGLKVFIDKLQRDNSDVIEIEKIGKNPSGYDFTVSW